MLELMTLTRLTLGIIFIASALPKLRDLRGFVRGAEAYRVLSPQLTRLYAWPLPFVELSVGILMLMGWLLPLAAALAVLMLLSFAIALAINAARKRVLDCHCWGAGNATRIGWHSLIRDVVLLIPAVVLFIASIAETKCAMAELPNTAHLLPTAGSAVLLALTYALVVVGLDVHAEVNSREVNR
jgi:uncharacterized membrane protein YphA (DoxX/SURF4 family)